MPPIAKIDKESIVEYATQMVRETGWDSINARSLAKKAGISTKPLYRLYKNMDEIKALVYERIYEEYDSFINDHVDKQKALITLCVAYVEFAKLNKNMFKCLFLANNLKWTSIDDVLNEKWNQSTIINLVNKAGYNFDSAKSLFMHLWLYANGLATLIATNDIDIDDDDIIKRIVKIYKELVK